jgi:hypothetical protein
MKLLAFQSDSWKAAELTCIELQTVFRQTDTEFITILNQIRKGQVTPQAMELLEQCRVPLTERTNSFTGLLVSYSPLSLPRLTPCIAYKATCYARTGSQ